MSRSVNVAFFESCHKGILKLCSEQSLDTEKIYLPGRLSLPE